MMGEIEMMLEMRPENKDWHARVIKTVAIEDIGIDTLCRNVQEHHAFLVEHDLLTMHREENIRSTIVSLVESRYSQTLWNETGIQELLQSLIAEVLSGRKSPTFASQEIWEHWLNHH
jgi:putative protein kinase ArgK-like GTPase of G3E family